MSWYERMNDALNYIEDHLLDTIDLREAARLAGCTTATFQRTFSIVVELPLSEYIRRRRMTLAALELQQSDIKVIDLALKYGYESPEAFTRAFHNIHGVSPSHAREKGVDLTAFPRISFLLTIKGATAMNFRIEQHPAYFMSGKGYTLSTTNDNHLVEIPKIWSTLIQDGTLEKLHKEGNIQQPLFEHLGAIHAVCDYKMDINEEEMSYLIGVMNHSPLNQSHYSHVEIPASTWAIFKTEQHTIEQTSKTLQQLIHRVYTEWLPSTSYTKLDGFDLELYYQDNSTYWTEFWIRVVSI